MEPISLSLETIYSLAIRIYEMTEQVKANKEQCQLLVLRITDLGCST